MPPTTEKSGRTPVPDPERPVRTFAAAASFDVLVITEPDTIERSVAAITSAIEEHTVAYLLNPERVNHLFAPVADRRTAIRISIDVIDEDTTRAELGDLAQATTERHRMFTTWADPYLKRKKPIDHRV